MSLFQKKPQTSNSAPLYTIGLSKTVIIVGLGNIGNKYEGTRHNIGFEAVDKFVKTSSDFSDWVEKKDLRSLQSSGSINGTRVIVIKPTTLMNRSGEAVQATAHFYKVPSNDIIVVHDELDIAFGQIRMRLGGSPAGNNGVKSLIDHITETFNRVRVGIADENSDQIDSAAFVLAKFDSVQQKYIADLTNETNSILTEFVASGTLPHDTRQFI